MKELVPLLAFGLTYYFTPEKAEKIYYATAVLMASMTLLCLVDYIKNKTVNKQFLFGTVMVLVLGSLTLLFHDVKFIQWKATIVSGILGVILVVGSFLGEKMPLKKMLGAQLVLPENIWAQLHWFWAFYMFLCAGLNYYFAFYTSEATWVQFKMFGLMGVLLVFIIIQMLWLFKYFKKMGE